MVPDASQRRRADRGGRAGRGRRSGGSLAYNCRLSQELERTEAAHRQMLAAQEKLHHTLTQQVADRLDGDLRELAAVPLTMATLLENRRDWDEEHSRGP